MILAVEALSSVVPIAVTPRPGTIIRTATSTSTAATTAVASPAPEDFTESGTTRIEPLARGVCSGVAGVQDVLTTGLDCWFVASAPDEVLPALLGRSELVTPS